MIGVAQTGVCLPGTLPKSRLQRSTLGRICKGFVRWPVRRFRRQAEKAVHGHRAREETVETSTSFPAMSKITQPPRTTATNSTGGITGILSKVQRWTCHKNQLTLQCGIEDRGRCPDHPNPDTMTFVSRTALAVTQPTASPRSPHPRQTHPNRHPQRSDEPEQAVLESGVYAVEPPWAASRPATRMARGIRRAMVTATPSQPSSSARAYSPSATPTTSYSTASRASSARSPRPPTGNQCDLRSPTVGLRSLSWPARLRGPVHRSFARWSSSPDGRDRAKE